MRADFHRERKPTLNNAVIPTLAPGEKLETVSAERPNAAFSDFTRQMLLGVSTALGISVEQLTNDYSETNYSMARGAIAETERSVKRRLAEFDSGMANPIYATWMDEGFQRGLFPLPANAPAYLDARTAYSRCRWRAPVSSTGSRSARPPCSSRRARRRSSWLPSRSGWASRIWYG
jgi:capsid protein